MKKKGNSFLYIGCAITALVLLLVVVGWFWSPYSPTEMNPAEKMLPPSARHWMGTDNFGRDIFSRVLDGVGISFQIALCVVAIGCAAGTAIGALCGYFGGVADVILTRLCDALTAFPSVLLALVIVSVIGGGTYQIVFALGILFIPSFARVVRTEFARCRNENYIFSARLMGAGNGRIMLRHILPNTLPVLLPAIAIGFNNAILSEASMSYLGIGIQPPRASLGLMLSDSQTYLKSAPWYALSVGATMVLMILGFSLLGEGLQQKKRRS